MSGYVNVRLTFRATFDGKREVIYEGPSMGVHDALVNYYCDNGMSASVLSDCLRNCSEFADAIAHGEDTSAYQRYFDCACEVI